MPYRLLFICVLAFGLGAMVWTLKVEGVAPLGEARAASAAYDPAPGDGIPRSAEADSGADLSLAILKVPGPIRAGQEIVYLLTVANVGPEAARGVRLEDTLPANSTFVAADPGCEHHDGSVSCDLGDVARRAMRHLTIVVRAEHAGGAVDEAKLLSWTHDADRDDRSAQMTTAVITG